MKPRMVYSLIAVLLCSLHAQQSVVADEQVFFLQDGTRIRDINTPELGKEIRIQRAAGLKGQILNDDLEKNIMDTELGDIDNDGDDELVILGRTRLVVFEIAGSEYELAHEKTLSLYDMNIYSDHPAISFDEIFRWLGYRADFGRPAEHVSEEDRSGGRLAIGDIDNDGDNEIILTMAIAYINTGYRALTEVLKWTNEGYVLIDVFRRCSLNDGIFILDLDNDGTNEIIIGRGSNYGIFGHVENPQDYPTDRSSIYGQGGSFTGQYQPKGVLHLFDNSDEVTQVSNIVFQDGLPVIFRVGLRAIAGDTRTLGTIRNYILDPARIPRLTSERLLQGTPAVPNFSGEDLEQKYKPVQVPTTGELLQRRAEVDRLSIGDYDGDGILDVVANMPGRALVYELAK